MIYPVEIIEKQISKEYLRKFLDKPFKEAVKFVVDVERGIIAFGGELHSDGQEVLIEKGSDARNIWGGNFFLPENEGRITIEYSSLINVKPAQKSFSMDIRDKEICEKIEKALKKMINDL